MLDYLNEISKLYLSDFGIFIEIEPDEEERKMLEQNIQMALQRDSINLEDAIDIREIRNLKLANQILKLKRVAKARPEFKKKKLLLLNNKLKLNQSVTANGCSI